MLRRKLSESSFQSH